MPVALMAWSVEARRLEGGLVRLGPAAGEEDALHVLVGDGDELLGELDRGNVGRAGIGGEVGELAHLLRGGLGELLAPMAHVGVPKTGEAVDVLPALDVGDGGAAPLHVHHGLEVIARVMQRMDQMILVGLDQLCRLHGHGSLLE
jgi:hypothetical protein